MTITATTTYHPVEPLIRDLRDYIHRDRDRTTAFHTAINTALYPHNGGAPEMAREGIRSLDDFLCFADALLRWVPRVTTTGDELLNKIVVFYWVIDQPALRGWQTPFQPATSAADLTWLSYWLVCFARQQGQFLHSRESAASLYTFYLNERYNNEAGGWEEPAGGWRSFNHWFGRRWKDVDAVRPVAAPGDGAVVVCVADAVVEGWSTLTRAGEVMVPPTTTMTTAMVDCKSVVWPVDRLLQGISGAREVFGGGSFVHACLGPADYHRQHAPVSGRIVQVRNIQDQVYLQIAKKKEGRGLRPDRGLRRDAKEEVRRDRMPCKGPRILDAPDNAGCQWCQTRGVIVIQTEDFGRVAVVLIGMAQISSVVMTVHEGQWVRKGDEISYFQFGGSDVVMVFENPVRFREDLLPGISRLNVREELAVFK
ncbi:phosphatidylserine decarboxylase [Aspergillus aculeatinus CBS 121060]|uniref:Uncharacterized protein n=1 Tax=Aspergillus aculeatinus CBS 121060 TaxID=1448322 RepID=A0ACD1HMA4_9EURO|nr:hypothetical protein BO66DRAFT_434055 [Aspergillus aculeatinus CBS 121060]RAH74948.1 hypothetical protein BO66DRAFT_434055 [Aspergillus aculeatinus CBS 121060]